MYYTPEQLHAAAVAYRTLVGFERPILDARGIKWAMAHDYNFDVGLMPECFDTYAQFDTAPFAAWGIETAQVDAVEGLWVECRDYESTSLSSAAQAANQGPESLRFGVNLLGDVLVIWGEGDECDSFWVFNRYSPKALR